MVDLRKETHGPGAMKGVNLVAIAYDNRVYNDPESGEAKHHYLDLRMDPNDTRAAGQTTLALVTKKDEKAPSGYNNTGRYAASQMDSIKEIAGDNTTPVLNKDGEALGTAYAFKADLLVNKGQLVANTKTLEASDHQITPNIQEQIFNSMRDARAAKDAAKEAAKNDPSAENAAPEAEAPEVEAPEAEDQGPGLG